MSEMRQEKPRHRSSRQSDQYIPCKKHSIASVPTSRSELEALSSPRNWTNSRKWLITGFVLLMTFMVGLNALSIGSAASAINGEFSISDENFSNSYWAVTAWNVGAIFGPVVGLPLMETFGLRTTYLISWCLFFLFVIPQAFAPNYATLIVTRFFAGGFGSIVQNAVANVIGDIWGEQEKNYPVTLFNYAYLAGFTIGPTLGSAILQALSWRWIFYVELCLYGPLLPIAWSMIKETRATVILKAAVKKQELRQDTVTKLSSEDQDKPSLRQLLHDAVIRPIHLFLTEPVVFFFSLWSGLAVGNVFLASQSIAQTFGTNYGFNYVQAGYVESSMFIGETIGLAFCFLQIRIYRASATKNQQNPGKPIPEYHLTSSIPFSFLGVVGLVVYGWTSDPEVTWVASAAGLGLVGAAIMVIVTAAVAYVQDAYGIYGGSAVAAAAALENLISGFLPLASQSMYTNLGFQWASTLLAGISLLLSFAPVALYLKGSWVRERSKFMQPD